eukprot:COSAG01_NODE_3247_length_6356_cov_29.609397_5_plen_79_part_00
MLACVIESKSSIRRAAWAWEAGGWLGSRQAPGARQLRHALTQAALQNLQCMAISAWPTIHVYVCTTLDLVYYYIHVLH